MSSFELCILTYSYAPVTHYVHGLNCDVTQRTSFLILLYSSLYFLLDRCLQISK